MMIASKGARKLRVCCVDGSGVRLRIPLLRALAQHGFEVGAAGPVDEPAFADAGIAYQRYPLRRSLDPRADWRAFESLRNIFRSQQPDLVHSFTTKPSILAPLAAASVGIPCVRTVTGLGYVYASNSPLAMALRPLYRNLQRRASRAAEITVFQNQDDREFFLRNRIVRTDDSALVAGSGVDPAALAGLVPQAAELGALRARLGLADRPVVSMVARLLRHKGIIEFLEAARLVRRRMPTAAFLLIGPEERQGPSGVPRRAVEAFGEDVAYLGPRDDVPALLALSDVFALPSFYREGVPRALLEAGALGLPLITTNVAGCREVVVDRWNGRVVKPRDASGLADAIMALLRDGDLRLAMGKRSRMHVEEQFSLAHVSDCYADIYQRVTNPRWHGGKLGQAA